MRKFSFAVCMIGMISCGSNGHQAVDPSETDDVVVSKYSAGAEVYEKNCVACHQAFGEGVEGAFPPLAHSDYLLADKDRAIHQIIYGSSGEMTVNGVIYNSIMPPQPVTDEEVRDVMNYILNAWGNSGGEVTLEDVQRVKAQQ